MRCPRPDIVSESPTPADWPKSFMMYHVAIRSIRHRGLRRWFVHGNPSKLHPAHAARIKQILDALDHAIPLEELAEPTYRLHPLKGDRKGQWSVRVDRTRRIVFRARGEDVFDVDLIDYH